MASAASHMDMEEEALCPICMGWLTDPVSVDCGHNFCRGCIMDFSDNRQEQGLECAVCRAPIQTRNFRPNWQLANIVEKIKLLEPKKAGKDMCKKHKEKLHLFCREDEELVCVFCDRSPEHKSHTVVFKDDVVQEYRDRIESCLEPLRKERERLLANKAYIEKKTQDLLKSTETERQRAVDEFRQLHQFLEEQEKLLLNRMEKREKEIAAERDQIMAKFSEDLSSLQGIIQEMEEKCQQPAGELLLDIRSTLQRSEKREAFENLVAFPPELKWSISEFQNVNFSLESAMKLFKGDLLARLLQKAANITLDPDTAHPILILSEDLKSVRRGNRWQNLPRNPERFNKWPFVLGHEGFTAGSHFWDVIVGSAGTWAMGVAKKSVRRKGDVALSPEEGIWTMMKSKEGYRAFNISDNSLLSLHGESRRIRVFLNYEGGQLSFFDADEGALLYAFSGASFSGETLLPFFQLWGREAHLIIA